MCIHCTYGIIGLQSIIELQSQKSKDIILHVHMYTNSHYILLH